MTKQNMTANERKQRQRDKMRKWLIKNYNVATAEALVMLLMNKTKKESK